MELIEFDTDMKELSHRNIVPIQMLADVFDNYSMVPISFTTDFIYEVLMCHEGFAGFKLVKKEIQEFTKNYDTLEPPKRWIEQWKLDNWCMLLIRNEVELPIAGALVAWKEPGVNMLRGRTDLAVLWDLRVDPQQRGNRLGTSLFQKVVLWSQGKGVRTLHVETQNNNPGACNFYMKMGCHLVRIDTEAYPDLPEEKQLVWGYDIANIRMENLL